jgi:hypothetical protein
MYVQNCRFLSFLSPSLPVSSTTLDDQFLDAKAANKVLAPRRDKAETTPVSVAEAGTQTQFGSISLQGTAYG